MIHFHYYQLGNPRIVQILVQELVESLLENLHDHKIHFLSTHDITLSALYNYFQLTNYTCIYQNFLGHQADCLTSPPKFAESLVLELWRDEKDGQYLKFIINGN